MLTSEACSQTSETFIMTSQNAALWAIAAGLFAIAEATTAAARHLGTGNTPSEVGALGLLADGARQIAEAIEEHGDP